MKSNTREVGSVFDMGSLYAEMSTLTDRRDARGLRYQLENLLIFMVIAKLCGEDKPSGIAEWVAYRVDLLTAAMQFS